MGVGQGGLDERGPNHTQGGGRCTGEWWGEGVSESGRTKIKNRPSHNCLLKQFW